MSAIIHPAYLELELENAALRARVASDAKLIAEHADLYERLAEAERLLRAGLMENLDKGPNPLQRVREWEDEVRDFLAGQDPGDTSASEASTAKQGER